MNWFKRTRVDWVREAVQIYGFINRGHVMKKFGVSVVQASQDIRDAMRENPGLMALNASSKRYELIEGSEE